MPRPAGTLWDALHARTRPFATRPWCARWCGFGTHARFVGHVLSIKLLTTYRPVWHNNCGGDRVLTLGSLFDGIGGWQLAAVHAGVTPVWSSEIDDFPAAVTAHHFPDVKRLGDTTKIDVDKLEPVDIICAGSPCQDLSVAGKREGLAGERSGLFRTAIKLVHRLRARTGKPRFFVWENVPGAFSSNRGTDFRTVLEEIGQTEIPMPERNKWAQSGVVQCDECEIAWRVLDAQYWGVPQRRKRIFLVADFAETGRRAAEILFEPEGVQGDTPQGEGAREGATAGAEGGAGAASICWEMNQPRNRINDYSTKTISPTLTARMGTGGNQVPIVHSYCIAGNTIDRKPQNGGNGMGSQEELSYTLNTVDRHAVAECFPQNAYDKFLQGTPLTTLKRCGGNCGGGSENLIVNISSSVGEVRRLTPTECERLQGLPDGYTDVEFKGKPAPDSRRYKALGNGMAQPCADYVIRRIVESGKKGIDNTPSDVV